VIEQVGGLVAEERFEAGEGRCRGHRNLSGDEKKFHGGLEALCTPNTMKERFGRMRHGVLRALGLPSIGPVLRLIRPAVVSLGMLQPNVLPLYPKSAFLR